MGFIWAFLVFKLYTSSLSRIGGDFLGSSASPPCQQDVSLEMRWCPLQELPTSQNSLAASRVHGMMETAPWNSTGISCTGENKGKLLLFGIKHERTHTETQTEWTSLGLCSAVLGEAQRKIRSLFPGLKHSHRQCYRMNTHYSLLI